VFPLGEKPSGGFITLRFIQSEKWQPLVVIAHPNNPKHNHPGKEELRGSMAETPVFTTELEQIVAILLDFH
jgi:hypothetical protein